jgi:DNA (cytosine-5)-methyltransferase 1
VFIIGHLRGERRPKVFPFGEIYSGDIESELDDTESEIARTVSSRFRKGVGNTESRIIDVLIDVNKGQRIHSIEKLASTLQERDLKFVGGIMGDKNKKWLEDGKENSRNFPQGQRVYSPEGISAQLTAQGGGWGAKTGLYAVPILTPDREVGRQNGRKWKTDGEPMFTLTSMDIQGVIENKGIRRLTPLECERLQGFPDNWTKHGIDKNGKQIPISDSQRYKCCGNAVTTNVITDIGERLK